jgi:hypothetical protein
MALLKDFHSLKISQNTKCHGPTFISASFAYTSQLNNVPNFGMIEGPTSPPSHHHHHHHHHEYYQDLGLKTCSCDSSYEMNMYGFDVVFNGMTPVLNFMKI